MDKDFSELVEYLDERFQKTATKEDLERFATKEDLEHWAANFVTLEEFDNFRAEVKQEFMALRASINSLTNSVDKLVKAISDLKTEYFAIKNQLDRHEKWIQQLAQKMGVNLPY